MTAEERKERLKELLLTPGMNIEEQCHRVCVVEELIIAERAEQLKEDLAAVNRIPQYMVAVIDGWTEGSAPSPQGKMLQNIAKASARFVEELIPDLFPKEADHDQG